MKAQFYLLTLCLFLFSCNTFNSEKDLEYNLSFYKIKNKTAPNFLFTENLFKKIPKSKSLGIKNGDYWFKLTFKNNENHKNLIGYIPTHNIDRIDIYQRSNNQLNHISSTGNSISQNQLPVDYKFPAFKINALNNTIYYLKVNFPKEANFPLKITTEKAYLSYIMNKKTINSFYYGTAIMIILLNLFFFFKFKDKTYLFYLLFLSSLMINFLIYDGSLIHIFRGNSFYYKLEMLIHLSNEIWFLLFSIKFLNLHKNHPKLIKVFFLFPIIITLLYLANLITSNYIFVAIADALGITLLPILWCFGIYYIKQIPYAKFYVFGYLLLIPFAVFFIIGFPFGIWKVNGEMLIIKIASWLDIIVLTYAISYRMKIEETKKITQEIQDLNINQTIDKQPKLVDSYFSLLKENNLKIEPLTLREIDILDLICQGLNNLEIGNKLFISKNTVKYHIKNIYNKAKVNNRNELKEKLSIGHECKSNENQLITT